MERDNMKLGRLYVTGDVLLSKGDERHSNPVTANEAARRQYAWSSEWFPA